MRYEERPSRDNPIGVLDSGVGGLTIWREIRRQLPRESTIYIGDHLYQPFGGKSISVIRQRVKRLIAFLIKAKAKIIIIACNTGTVAGIDLYRRWYPTIPIIGVVPVVKTAVSLTKTKHIAVLSTINTAASSYQKRLIRTFADGCLVENIGVPDLASLIEKGDVSNQMDSILRQYLQTKKMNGVDVIALGCTHFPFIRQKISEIVGKGITIIDSKGAVARRTHQVLAARALLSTSHKPYSIFRTTGDAPFVSRVASELMGIPIRFTYARV